MRWIGKNIVNWLLQEPKSNNMPLCDYNKLRHEMKPADVILVEGKSKIANVISILTKSPWTHSALYIGRIHEIEDRNLRAKITNFYNGSPEEQLVIESYLGKGTIISPISDYAYDNIRICRPTEIDPADRQKVIEHACSMIGHKYDVRQIFDLARLLLPWKILPQSWLSSLFAKQTETTKTVCSTMISIAFQKINYPILPDVTINNDSGLKLRHMNPKLHTPRDFDYSPYFSIIKYPFMHLNSYNSYTGLPWEQKNNIATGVVNHNKSMFKSTRVKFTKIKAVAARFRKKQIK